MPVLPFRISSGHDRWVRTSAEADSHDPTTHNDNSNNSSESAMNGNQSISNSLPVQRHQQPAPSLDQSIASIRSTNSASSTRSDQSSTGRPGAFHVTRSATGQPQVYHLTVPKGVRPGDGFMVHAGTRQVRVQCPPTSQPGSVIQITLPPETVTNYTPLRPAPLTAAPGNSAGGGAVDMSKEVALVNKKAEEMGGSAQTHLVVVPPNIKPGMQFPVHVAQQRFMVSCPEGAGPGMRIRIVPPVVREVPEAVPKTQVFEAAVPVGARPGQPFAVLVNGQHALVTCPNNVVPGQRVRFELPVNQVVGSIQLAYESQKGGWKRTIRATDLKFQWVRLEGSGKLGADTKRGSLIDVDLASQFDFMKSAYVRKVKYMEGNDARMRTGTVELSPANEAVVDSRLVNQNQSVVSYNDIVNVQGKPLHKKQEWFQSVCQQLMTPWEEGHVKICVRRSHLLIDSVDAVMGLGRDEMRQTWRIEFLGEPGRDASGLTKEWFQLITEQLFDPACGLWIPSANNQACLDINPVSEMSCPDDHLIYYRFLGRVIGRALFAGRNIKGHMVRTIYKHLLGWPVSFEDVKAQDEEFYQSLKQLTTMDDVSLMCLDFTTTEETLGIRIEKELVEGGAKMQLTNDNLNEYLEATIRHRLFNRTMPQLTEVILGFYDVVPEAALTVFDAYELELILCGLPKIDVADWRRNTLYAGVYEQRGSKDPVVQWFWEVVRDEFDQEMLARLLQFCTGTSSVPLGGFARLQGPDGTIKPFTIESVDLSLAVYPRSHTCFNRIDLPMYKSKTELREKLRLAVTTAHVGFDME